MVDSVENNLTKKKVNKITRTKNTIKTKKKKKKPENSIVQSTIGQLIQQK